MSFKRYNWGVADSFGYLLPHRFESKTQAIHFCALMGRNDWKVFELH